MISLKHAYSIISAVVPAAAIAVLVMAPSLAGASQKGTSSQGAAVDFAGTGQMTSPRSLPTAKVSASSRKVGSVNMASVVVSHPGNASDPATQVGSVDHEFRMGQFDITIGQYTLFLNVVA